MIAGLLDHVWQSTLFLGGIVLLSLVFRRNGAGVRFWLWFAASVKFLVPFAGLAALGAQLSRPFAASLPRSFAAIQPAAERFSAPARSLAAPHVASLDFAPLLLGAWMLGAGLVLGFHLLRWLRMRAAMAGARDIAPAGALPGPVAIKASASMMEPGLVGIWNPVIVLPQGLMTHLSAAERDSILAHEFSHWKRRDNVTAAIHMAVESLFWFYPLVWLIGARLVAERERACDESVLADGHAPEVYAGGILKVCRFCIQSPLACVPGASGADLKRRVRQIMASPAAIQLSGGKRLLLAGAGLFAFVPPILAGFPDAPLAAAVQREVVSVQAGAAQAVSAVVEQITPAPAAPAKVQRPGKARRLATAPATLAEAERVAAPPVEVAAEVAPVSPPAILVVAPPAPPPSQPTAKQAVLALDPSGAGDPDAQTCRAPQLLPGSRLAGPRVCKTNRVWAELRANRQDIGPDGRMIVYLDDFQRQKAGEPNCRDVFFGRAGAISVAGPSSTFCF